LPYRARAHLEKDRDEVYGDSEGKSNDFG